MGIFSRGRAAKGEGPGSVVPAAERSRLAQVGRAVYVEGGFIDVSAFYLSTFMQLGLPTDEFAERLVTDLVAAAGSEADEWAWPGALHVAVDFDGSNVASRGSGGALIDGALRVLAANGVGGERIPMFLMPRWNEVTGGA